MDNPLWHMMGKWTLKAAGLEDTITLLKVKNLKGKNKRDQLSIKKAQFALWGEGWGLAVKIVTKTVEVGQLTCIYRLSPILLYVYVVVVYVIFK
jgi:hypothetical protein